MSAPIMSRFDLFFVVLDDPADVADYNTARHIVRVHQLRDDAVSPPFTPAALRRYIRFARTILPVLREDAARLLWESYRNLRQEDVGAGGMLGAARSTARNAYRITVRQLESLVRLSEALARAHCSDVITVAHVREAVRLLRRSIVHVEMDDVDVADDSAVGSTDSADHADSTGDVLARVLDAGDAPAAAQPLKVTIKREDFDRIRAMLVLKLHDVEEKDSARQATASTEPSDNTESPDSADSPDEGMRHADLIDWYLAQREDHMESELDFAAEQQKATMVLKYMLDVEGCVIALRNAEASHASDADHGTDAASAADHDTESRGPLLMLHPNFAIDS